MKRDANNRLYSANGNELTGLSGVDKKTGRPFRRRLNKSVGVVISDNARDFMHAKCDLSALD
jgi:hypothetical protein